MTDTPKAKDTSAADDLRARLDRPQIPPYRTWRVWQRQQLPMDTRPSAAVRTEVLVHAHQIDQDGPVVVFGEFRIVGSELRLGVTRMFKEWDDVEEILKTNGQVH